MPTFGSLFAGAGLMDLGFEQAGWECRWAVEWDKSAVATWKHNRPGYEDRIICGDVRTVTAAQLSQVDLIIGGPPCQGLSSANSKRVHKNGEWHRWKEDPRNVLYLEFKRLVEDLKPKYFVMENVKNMFTTGASEGGKPGPIMIEVLTDFTLAGYRVAADVLDAADYGVPQHRERVFVIGVRADLPDSIRYPVQTHGDKDSGFLPWWTVRMAIGDLPEPGTHIVVDAQSTYPDPYKSLDEPANALRSCVSGCGLMMGQGLMPANHDEAQGWSPERLHAILTQAERWQDKSPSPRVQNPDKPSYTIDGKAAAGTNKDIIYYPPNHEGGIPVTRNGYELGDRDMDPDAPAPALNITRTDHAPPHPGPLNHDAFAPLGTLQFESSNRPLEADEPSDTFKAHHNSGVPILPGPQARRLTPRECARLQSVPDWYFFCGSKSATYRGIGNGVPVELARRIAATLIGSELGRELKPYQIQMSFLNMLG